MMWNTHTIKNAIETSDNPKLFRAIEEHQSEMQIIMTTLICVQDL